MSNGTAYSENSEKLFKCLACARQESPCSQEELEALGAEIAAAEGSLDVNEDLDALRETVRSEYAKLRGMLAKEERDMLAMIERFLPVAEEAQKNRTLALGVLRQELEAGVLPDISETRKVVGRLGDMKTSFGFTPFDEGRPFCTLAVSDEGGMHLVHSIDDFRKAKLDLESSLPTGFPEPASGGCVFDPSRRVLCRTSRNMNAGKDLFVSRIDTNTVERMENCVPFPTVEKPIFDNDKYVYFAGAPKKFGRLSIETWAFEKLAEPPYPFCDLDGFFAAGRVYCFSSKMLWMAYDVKSDVWTVVPLLLRGRCVVHPWRPDTVICVSDKYNVAMVDLRRDAVEKQFECTRELISSHLDLVALPAPGGEFFLLGCEALPEKPWRVFSSQRDAWWNLNEWPTPDCSSSTLFFDREQMAVYYQQNGRTKWTVTRL